MTHRKHALAAAVALAAATSVVAADDPAPTLKFAWPIPSKAIVTERIWKGGMTWVERYSLALERQGDDFRAHFDDVSIIEFGGKPADDPSVKPMVERAAASARLKLDVLVGADGRAKDVVDFEKKLAEQFELLSKSVPEANREALRAQFFAPELKELMRRDAMRSWQSWTGEWVGLSIPEGAPLKCRHDVRDFEGKDHDAACVRRREPAKTAGRATLVREAEISGDDAKPMLDAWIKAQTARSGQAPPPDLLTGLTLTNRASVDLDPATLRPDRALREDVAVVHRKERKDLMASHERREFVFEWAAAEAPKSDK